MAYSLSSCGSTCFAELRLRVFRLVLLTVDDLPKAIWPLWPSPPDKIVGASSAVYAGMVEHYTT